MKFFWKNFEIFLEMIEKILQKVLKIYVEHFLELLGYIFKNVLKKFCKFFLKIFEIKKKKIKKLFWKKYFVERIPKSHLKYFA